MGNLAEMPHIFPGQLESYGMAGSWTIPSTTRKDKPPNGLEMSRPASPSLVSRRNQTPGWPGWLHRVVRRHRGQAPAPNRSDGTLAHCPQSFGPHTRVKANKADQLLRQERTPT